MGRHTTDASKVGVVEGSECPEGLVLALTPTAESDSSHYSAHFTQGGKEARNTNEALMRIVKEALGNFGCADAVSMVSTREAIGDLLKMDQYIDLIIPRGSGELVKSIKEQSKLIPVLGHAEGVCHVFLDKVRTFHFPCPESVATSDMKLFHTYQLFL